MTEILTQCRQNKEVVCLQQRRHFPWRHPTLVSDRCWVGDFFLAHLPVARVSNWPINIEGEFSAQRIHGFDHEMQVFIAVEKRQENEPDLFVCCWKLRRLPSNNSLRNIRSHMNLLFIAKMEMNVFLLLFICGVPCFMFTEYQLEKLKRYSFHPRISFQRPSLQH